MLVSLGDDVPSVGDVLVETTGAEEPAVVADSLESVATNWNEFLRQKSSEVGASSNDGNVIKQPSLETTSESKTEQRTKSNVKRAPSAKKREKTAPRSSLRTAITDDDIKEVLNDAASNVPKGRARKIQNADSRTLDMILNPGGGMLASKMSEGDEMKVVRKMERFPTPPGFEQAWDNFVKNGPKQCPGATPGKGKVSGQPTGFFGRFGLGQSDQPPPTALDSNGPEFPSHDLMLVVASDWKTIKAKSKVLSNKKTAASQKGSGATQVKAVQSSGSGFFKFGKAKEAKAADETVEGSESTGGGYSNVSMDFYELAKMNAGIIGANMTWTEVVLQSFEGLIGSCTNRDERVLISACDILALKLSSKSQDKRAIKLFETCMLSSVRALLPETWDSKHEEAWIAAWACVSKQLEATLDLPGKYARPAAQYVNSLSQEQKQKLGMRVFTRLFKEQPGAEDSFKQSNARLAYIVIRGLDMAVQTYQEPARMYDEITALGLRHIMFQAKTRFFQHFVSAVVAELQLICKDDLVIDALNWILCVIGSVMVRTIDEGATPLLKAVVRNDPIAVKKALAAAPRAERAQTAIGSDG